MGEEDDAKPYIGRNPQDIDDDGAGAAAAAGDDKEYESRNVGSRGHDDDGDDDDTRKLRAAPDFDGPVKDRHCTDILCSLLLIASWIVMTGIGGYAIANGNIDLVIRPLDYDGNVCGTDFGPSDMTDFPVLLYVNDFSGGVCVKKCPDLTNKTQDGLTDMRTLVTYGGIWQVEGGGAELPADFIQVGNYTNSSDAIFCTNDACYPNNSTLKSWVASGVRSGKGFAFYAASTYEVLFRCVLTTAAQERISYLTGQNLTRSGSEASLVDDAYTFWGKLYGDVYMARNYILGFGFGLSLAVSLVYIFLMRLPVLLTAVIWTSILLTILMFFVGGYYAWTQASEWDDAEPQTVSSRTIHLTSGFALGMFGIGALLVLMACCLRRAIMDAIKCTKEAGKAVNSMILILLVPVLQTIGLLAFMLPWLYYAAYLASLGKITTTEVPLGVEVEGLTGPQPTISYRTYDFDDFTENCAWYLLFSFFWTANFIVAMGDVSSACDPDVATMTCCAHFPASFRIAATVDHCRVSGQMVLYQEQNDYW
jgi:hypothetical protein